MKERLDSAWTPFLKWYAPGLWLLMFAHVAWSRHVHAADFGDKAFILLLLTIPLAWITWLQWRAVDRAEIDGGALLLVRRGIEQRVPLADVMNVWIGWGDMVRVRLRGACRFGDEVIFNATRGRVPGRSSRRLCVERLVEAADAARMGRRA